MTFVLYLNIKCVQIFIINKKFKLNNKLNLSDKYIFFMNLLYNRHMIEVGIIQQAYDKQG